MICSCCGEDAANFKVGQRIEYVCGIPVPFVENTIECTYCGSEVSGLSCGESIHTLRALRKLKDKIEFLEHSMVCLIKNIGGLDNEYNSI